VAAPFPGRVEEEPVHGNRFWHGTVASPIPEPLRIEMRTVIERRRHHVPAPSGAPPLDRDRRAQLAPYLGPNERVVVDHPVLEPILEEVRAGSDSDRARTARGIYDWVVDNVEYKKVGSGWGNGDTFWACNERYGNCTDFHSLFISLARTEEIPARFEMGFPVPADRPAGEIGGYHCWVEFYLEGTGWFPIDASEAFKHPEKRELFYGTHPADRIHFTTGRDLRLGPSHRGKPLNYFIYPYVELEGRAWEGEIEREFRYGPAPAGDVAAGPGFRGRSRP
jgi:transglutaminase-like putative cysteine protease